MITTLFSFHWALLLNTHPLDKHAAVKTRDPPVWYKTVQLQINWAFVLLYGSLIPSPSYLSIQTVGTFAVYLQKCQQSVMKMDDGFYHTSRSVCMGRRCRCWKAH